MDIRMQEFSSWDADGERKLGEELDQLVRGDFSCVPAYLDQALPNTPYQLRKVPFARRYASELSGLYQRPVVRRFQAGALPQESWQKLATVYAGARADQRFATLEQAIWTQQSVAMLVLPAGLGVRLLPLSPWQMEPVVADSMAPSDPASWSSVTIQIADKIDAEHGTITYGSIYLTASEAWIRNGSSKRGLFQADGGHTFGTIPLAVVHAVDPVDGHVWAPVNEAVHNLQMALCQHESEMELVVRHSAWPQKVLENAGIAQMTETIQVGVDKVVCLTRSGDPSTPGPTLRVVQGQVPVTELNTYIEGRIKLYCAMLGIDPSAFLRVNTAVTVSARMFADASRREMRDRVRPVLLDLEAQVARLVAWVVSETGAVPMPWRDVTVELRWQDWTPSVDVVADSTAMVANAALGLDSPVDRVAMRDGISRTAALKKVKDTLKENRELGIVAGVADDSASQTEQIGADGEGADQAVGGEGDQDSEGDGAGAV